MSLKSYLESINTIKGWCIPQLWHCIQPVHQFQQEHNIDGPIAEIGVFHGKFFCGLALTKGVEMKHLAIDVFDQQEFNLDGAGEGDRAIFQSNLDKFGITNSEVHQMDSMTIPQSFINEHLDTYSLFSVDACHTVEHTLNDFRIAMQMVRKEGIIFIDDYNNANWPGVQEGISKFYLNNSSAFIPLLFTCNKLLICNISYHQLYKDAIYNFVSEHHPESRIKPVKRFGYDTLTIMPDWNTDKYLV